MKIDRQEGSDLAKSDVSRLLGELRSQDPAVQQELITLVYGELRKLAAHYFRGERTGHTLQPTALVHEVYIKLVNYRNLDVSSRSEFFALASQLMRRILVDHARSHTARKRGGACEILSLDEDAIMPASSSKQLIALDEALTRLANRDPRQNRIVELRFFGGLSEEEIGKLLGLSARTVKRDWRIAKAWLYQQLKA